MKITNKKIKKFIQESLRRILFESEDRIADLKDQFNLVYQKMSRAKTQEEFDQLNAEAERLDKEINRLTRTMFKEPEEPGEFDFMQSDPIEYPVPYQSGEMTAYEEDPLDRPATIDVTGGEGNEFSGGPMTQRDMNRREFAQNLGVGIGASALLGRQILDSDSLFSDPRLQIASDWFDEAMSSGMFARMYDQYLGSTDYKINYDVSPFDSYENIQDKFIKYITEYASEYYGEQMFSKFEEAGYQDPYEFNETKVMKQLDNLIEQKLREYYTEERVNQIIKGATKTTPLTSSMVEEAVEGYVDEMFDYNEAVDVIANGTIDDIESFENNQATALAINYMDSAGVNLSKSDGNKLLSAIRSKIDKIMSRLGGP